MYILVFSSGLIYAAPQLFADEVNTLTIPEEFNVLYVDDVKHANRFFTKGGAVLSLALGEHKIVVQYDNIFEKGDNFDRVKSEPLMLHFNVEDQGQYELIFKAPSTASAAKKFVKKPQLEIISLGAKKPLRISVSKSLQGKDYLAGFSQQKVSVDNKVNTSSGSLAKGSMAKEQLLYWWQQANELERQQFLEEIQAAP